MKNLSLNTVELGTQVSTSNTTAADPKGFTDAMASAVQKVDALQVASDQEAQKVAHGEGNLHELAISLEKADIAMRTAVKARNKLVDAYNEVMRMSV